MAGNIQQIKFCNLLLYFILYPIQYFLPLYSTMRPLNLHLKQVTEYVRDCFLCQSFTVMVQLVLHTPNQSLPYLLKHKQFYP